MLGGTCFALQFGNATLRHENCVKVKVYYKEENRFARALNC